MSIFLLLIVILKGICLYYCWKSISTAKKNTIQNAKDQSTNEELQDLENKLETLIEQNEKLSKELRGLKQDLP